MEKLLHIVLINVLVIVAGAQSLNNLNILSSLMYIIFFEGKNQTLVFPNVNIQYFFYPSKKRGRED